MGRKPTEQSDVRRQRQEEDAAAYAALRAFAVETIACGASEGLYRTVGDILQRTLRGSRPRWLLDVGCGPGRTLIDSAIAFPGARVVGIDGNGGALTVAYAIALLQGTAAEIDMRRWGFDSLFIEGRALKNVRLLQADAERLPFRTPQSWPGFDAVTCVNMLDRADDPDAVLDELSRVTRPGGWLILTTPLNWRQADGRYWETMRDLGALREAVERRGFACDLAFDGLVYREVMDPRRSATDWDVAVLSARRHAAG